MEDINKTHEHHHEQKGIDWYRIGTWGAVAIMGYYLITEHQAHVIQYLPFLLILACPLMHMFMHGGHGGHGGHGHHKHKEDQDNRRNKETDKEWK